MNGQVIQFPVKKTCWHCVHYNEDIAHCRLFDEPIDSEVFAAQDCHGFEVTNG